MNINAAYLLTPIPSPVYSMHKHRGVILSATQKGISLVARKESRYLVHKATSQFTYFRDSLLPKVLSLLRCMVVSPSEVFAHLD